MSTNDPFQELVDVLRRALTPQPSTSSSLNTAVSAPTSTAPSPAFTASPMAKPAPYSGSAEECDVFCPQRASKLPPHRPWDCAIDLLPGEPVPRGRIYPLSIPEEKAMEEYIKEALEQGYIRPSTSPAASSFFFVAKKDGGLRPCIDYRALNKITIKFRYPLPLVPAALEHLRGATVFTKLDLRSAYNLIRIREGDEWKTAFVTPTGHYEYLVMPYGLVNAPSVFQDFIHEVLREFLHKSVLVYIDDILIYSRSLAELALEEWRHWLEGAAHPFQVLTDHKNLEYLKAAKRLNPRQARWAMFFSRFNFSISYRPGSKNTKADALSRLYAPEEKPEKPDTILPESIFTSSPTEDPNLSPMSGKPSSPSWV
ncbi:uncharacterized protein [Chanodichthys erythropterus]|uniref:uncharacterized protein n=1 Tax=Chanodichthys erythropterus TaxID=933992 RepID=UPI00351F6D1E